MTNKTRKLLPALLFTLTTAVPSITAANEEQKPNSPSPLATIAPAQENGTITRNLLNMQRSGLQATRHQQYLSGSEMLRIFQRYLDSFEHRIPEFYVKTDFSAE